MAVNWKKGFRRIALICSILAAISGGVAGFMIADNIALQDYMLPLGTAVGGAVAFCGVWLAYLILERLVPWIACVILWVTRGFQDTEQKSGDTNNRYGFRGIATVLVIVVAIICASLLIVIMRDAVVGLLGGILTCAGGFLLLLIYDLVKKYKHKEQKSGD